MPPNPSSNSRLPRLAVWSGYGTVSRYFWKILYSVWNVKERDSWSVGRDLRISLKVFSEVVVKRKLNSWDVYKFYLSPEIKSSKQKMQNICNRDCWILLLPKLNSSLQTSPEPYFRLIQAFNWSKNNFGESHISQGLNRLDVTLSIPLFSLGATSLSPYKGLNYICHHLPPVYRRTLKAARVARDRRLLL